MNHSPPIVTHVVQQMWAVTAVFAVTQDEHGGASGQQIGDQRLQAGLHLLEESVVLIKRCRDMTTLLCRWISK